MKTLLINAHPDFSNSTHFSNQLQARFIEKYTAQFSTSDLTILNLYESDIPRIEDGQLWSIWGKQANHTKLSANEMLIYQQSEELLTQFKAHKRIVITSPLHNFNVTSRMKDYLDNLLIARETFRYVDVPFENGKASTGLLTNDYRALFLFASGSVYTQNNFYDPIDFAPKYLKAMFEEIMGFEKFDIVRAEGTATMKPAEILAKAKLELMNAFEQFYASERNR